MGDSAICFYIIYLDDHEQSLILTDLGFLDLLPCRAPETKTRNIYM